MIPVAKLLGRRGVPSALAIGSMIPDAWYFAPFLRRDDMHSLAGALLFCLPAALIAYAAFHLVFKQPMLALLPRRVSGRLAACATPGLPRVPWWWVVVSMLAGIATHLAWDAFTHEGLVPIVHERLFGVRLHRILQHASTILGTAFLVWWLVRRLAVMPPAHEVPRMERRMRIAVLFAMVLVPAAAFVAVLGAMNDEALRVAARAAGVTAFSSFGLIALVFSIAWRRR